MKAEKAAQPNLRTRALVTEQRSLGARAPPGGLWLRNTYSMPSVPLTTIRPYCRLTRREGSP
jgi:hypothetical protein